MNPDEAEALLADTEVVPCLEGGLREVRELCGEILAAGVPVLVGGLPSPGPGAPPRAQLLAREADLQAVANLMNARWRDLVASVGTTLPDPPSEDAKADEGAEPPCPACGHVAPLKDGACADCGLQLE